MRFDRAVPPTFHDAIFERIARQESQKIIAGRVT
jgi:hypothetical protein